MGYFRQHGIERRERQLLRGRSRVFAQIENQELARTFPPLPDVPNERAELTHDGRRQVFVPFGGDD